MSFVIIGILALVSLPAHALGLAELRVQSGLGQPFKAQVGLVGSDASDINSSCIRANVESTEGIFLAQANITINQSGQYKIIFLSTRQRLQEPAVKIIVDINCETQLHREFLILLDPPQFLPAQAQSESFLAQPDAAAQGSLTKSTQNPIDTASKNKLALDRGTKDRKVVSQSNTSDSSVPPVAKPRKAEKISKDVLKLSDDNVILQQGLKISDSLSSSLKNELVDNAEELRAAQAHMAAILRDESPDQIAKLDQAIAQKKILNLQNEAAQLKRQNQLDKAKLEEVAKNNYSRNWVIAISSLALVGLLVIAMLLIYIYRLHKTTEMSWWEHGRERKDAERRKSIEDIVNNVQASYEPGMHDSEYPPHVTLGPEFAPINPDSTLVQGGATSVNADQIFQTYTARAQPLTLEETNSSTFNFFSTRGSSVNVEEISDVTQEAEFWMSVNDPQRAIEILEPQANIEHPDSPVPWLYLLDLYRVVKNKEKYDNLRERFIIFFNANIPAFETELAHDGVRQLEDLTHVTERICGMWNGNEIIPFLQSLLIDDRDGKRMGFELPVYRDILLLISIAHELERMKALEGGDSSGWSAINNVVNSDTNLIDAHLDSDPKIIEFETIHFSKELMPKK